MIRHPNVFRDNVNGLNVHLTLLHGALSRGMFNVGGKPLNLDYNLSRTASLPSLGGPPTNFLSPTPSLAISADRESNTSEVVTIPMYLSLSMKLDELSTCERIMKMKHQSC